MTTNHKPATPLPWRDNGYKMDGITYPAKAVRGNNEETIVCRVDVDHLVGAGTRAGNYDAAYIAHAANAYPRLVETVKSALSIFGLQALRDCSDPAMLKGWRENQKILIDLLRELGEE